MAGIQKTIEIYKEMIRNKNISFASNRKAFIITMMAIIILILIMVFSAIKVYGQSLYKNDIPYIFHKTARTTSVAVSSRMTVFS
jgi:hypothetical protein